MGDGRIGETGKRENVRIALCPHVGMLFSAFEAPHHDARQAVLALEANEEILESDDIDDEPAGSVLLDLVPILAAGTGNRGLDDAVVLRAIRVGKNDEATLVMINGIIVLRLAFRYEARRGPMDWRHRSG